MSMKDIRDSAGNGPVNFVNNYTGAQTDVELVAAVAGARIVVDHFTITVSASARFFLSSGTATAITGNHYLGANGGYSNNDWNKRCALGESLTLTTDAGDCAVDLAYHLVPESGVYSPLTIG